MRSYVGDNIVCRNVEVVGRIKIGEHNDVEAVIRQLVQTVTNLQARVTALENAP